jgi:transposase
MDCTRGRQRALGEGYNQAVQRQQAFKYELMPNGDQQRQMRRFAGSCRYVFNRAPALQKERFEQGEKKFLRQTGRIPPVQEERTARMFPLPLPEADQARPGEQPHLPAEAGLAAVCRQLEYKLAWAGGILIAVPPHHTSTTCPRCDHISAQNRRTQALGCQLMESRR